MILYINTTCGNDIEVALKKGSRVVRANKIEAPYKQAEKLLPQIDRLLKESDVKLTDISGVEVENKGGTWTSLRIGVVLANTLSYALNIPIEGMSGAKISKKGLNIVKPVYNKEPSISKPAKVL